MRALDLFCCAGGASMGLARAGFEVHGVDIVEQPEYPFRFTRADAMSIPLGILRAYDLIWASPPCERYSAATRLSGKPEDHPDLVDLVRAMLVASGRPFIIENVQGAPLRDPITLCGRMFDLGVIRHRLFETSFYVLEPPHPIHKGSLVTGEYVTVAGKGGVPAWTMKERERRGLARHNEGESTVERWREAMGIDWMSRETIVQAIPPAFSEWLGRRAMEAINATRR